jgi:predicted nucleotidyltransferase
LIPYLPKPEYPIDERFIEILRAVTEETASEGIDYMLVGATARDILLTNVFGILAPRATKDMDFAVAVNDWGQFEALRSRLSARPGFKEGREQQRLIYSGIDDNDYYPLDLVPFGGVSNENSEIAWPPDMAIIMNIAGYDEALTTAVSVKFADDLEGKIISLAGLAMLKIFAWSDRGIENPKDAHDLLFLMENYVDAGNIDRAYDEGAMERCNYQQELAGPYLLGTDIQRIANAETLVQLKDILDRTSQNLSMQMIRAKPILQDMNPTIELRLQSLRKSLE